MKSKVPMSKRVTKRSVMYLFPIVYLHGCILRLNPPEADEG